MKMKMKMKMNHHIWWVV